MQKQTVHRPIIRYSLLACIILIQAAILLFFYNEYLNGKKLKAIEQQLQESSVLKNLTDQSRKELLTAQIYLQKYNTSHDKTHLQGYFDALKHLNSSLDSISNYAHLAPALQTAFNKHQATALNLPELATKIDSSYQATQTTQTKEIPFQLKKYKIPNTEKTFDIKVEHTADTIAKKGLFGRLKDAVTGNVEVKNNTTVITTKEGQLANTDKIKKSFDSIMALANRHYVQEINRYQTGVKTITQANSKLSEIYDKLLLYSNDLMEVYDQSVSDFRKQLEKQYIDQNSVTNKLRMYALMGIMLLMFFVLMIVMYYTRQAFVYEKKLKATNDEINRNLNFKSRILGMLSHEIRAPLKIINLFIDRIGKISKEEKVQSYLKSIKFTNNSLLIQATQILEYTKNQEQKIELKPHTFDLKTELENIFKAFQPYIESRNNLFEVTDLLPEPLQVYSDSIKVNQVFTNILGNANKFTENGTIRITVTSETSKSGFVTLFAKVTDTGLGISENDLQNIFEPYYQGVISDKVENLGAGLGLNLCKEIIDLFDGEISVQSKIGKGTEVSFQMNLNTPNQDEKSKSETKILAR